MNVEAVILDSFALPECEHAQTYIDTTWHACWDCGVALGNRGLPRGANRTRLNPEVTAIICSLIRQGAFMHVAAMAAGIPPSVFYQWMRRTEPHYREFQAAVNQARGEARAGAEISVAKTKPEVWLTRGPGRDKPGDEGWSSGSESTVNVKGRIEHAHTVKRYDLRKLTDAELEQLDGISARALLTEGEPEATDVEFEEVAEGAG